MINIKVERGSITCAVSGDLAMLCADTCMILKSIHECIKEKNEDAAELYKKSMSENLIDLVFGDAEELKRKIVERCDSAGVDVGDLVKDALIRMAKNYEMEEDSND